MIKCTFEDGGQAALRHVCVDNLIIKEGKVLMVKRTGKLLEGGKWGLIGGFVERDETLVKACEREIHEETGWIVKNIRLLRIKDRPDRPAEDRQNISFTYVSEAIEKTGDPDWESDAQKWFDLDKLPKPEEIAFDHYEDIVYYKETLLK